jgi:hypothetical protein
MNSYKICCGLLEARLSFDLFLMSCLMKSGYLQIGIAAFLLFFGLSDIILASPCEEELGGFPTHTKQVEILGNSHQYTSGDEIRSPQPEPSPVDGASCEECFCCCSHILPTSLFLVGPFDIIDQTHDAHEFFLVTSPPRDTFRPPRFV